MKIFDYLFGKKEQPKNNNESQIKSWRDYTYITDYFKEKYIFPESDSFFGWKEQYDVAVENNDIETIKLLTQGKDIHCDIVAIINFIEYFTLDKQSKSELGKLSNKISELITQGYAEDVSIIDEDRVIIKTKHGDIKFKRLSKVMQFDDESIETLQRKKRCHPEQLNCLCNYQTIMKSALVGCIIYQAMQNTCTLGLNFQIILIAIGVWILLSM